MCRVVPAFQLPDLIAGLHHVLDHVELVVHHTGVPEVLRHSLDVGPAHVDGHVLDRLRMSIVPNQFRGKAAPDLGVLPGRGEDHPLLYQVGQHPQAVMRLRRLISSAPQRH